MGLTSVLQTAFKIVFGIAIIYLIFIALLTIPIFQNQVIYLNRLTLTWFQDVNVPEQWGFLHNQVTPFTLPTPDGITLHAWHILPLELYRRNEKQLIEEPEGIADDITTRLSFKMLREDPDALLVLYFHGAAGTLGSGWRPPSYRAMSSGAPGRIHTVAIDYRGYGSSNGVPSEEGLLTDAMTLAKWAIEEVGIPPSRIVLFSQSLGTAVAVSLAHHLASEPDPVLFSGMVLVAPFADVELLTATYRVGAIIPLLDPIAYFPRLLAFFNTFIISKWPSKDKLADLVRLYENMPGHTSKYHITIIHAQDDYDIPWVHSDQVFWHAVNASLPDGISYEELEREKEESKMVLGAGGWAVHRQTQRGVIREEICKYGLHDRIMSYPVTWRQGPGEGLWKQHQQLQLQLNRQLNRHPQGRHRQRTAGTTISSATSSRHAAGGQAASTANEAYAANRSQEVIDTDTGNDDQNTNATEIFNHGLRYEDASRLFVKQDETSSSISSSHQHGRVNSSEYGDLAVTTSGHRYIEDYPQVLMQSEYGEVPEADELLGWQSDEDENEDEDEHNGRAVRAALVLSAHQAEDLDISSGFFIRREVPSSSRLLEGAGNDLVTVGQIQHLHSIPVDHPPANRLAEHVTAADTREETLQYTPGLQQPSLMEDDNTIDDSPATDQSVGEVSGNKGLEKTLRQGQQPRLELSFRLGALSTIYARLKHLQPDNTTWLYEQYIQPAMEVQAIDGNDQPQVSGVFVETGNEWNRIIRMWRDCGFEIPQLFFNPSKNSEPRKYEAWLKLQNFYLIPEHDAEPSPFVRKRAASDTNNGVFSNMDKKQKLFQQSNSLNPPAFSSEALVTEPTDAVEEEPVVTIAVQRGEITDVAEFKLSNVPTGNVRQYVTKHLELKQDPVGQRLNLKLGDYIHVIEHFNAEGSA